MNYITAILASIIVSLVSFIGALTLLLNDKILNKLLMVLISFSAGALIGGAFLHLIPEAVEHGGEKINVFVYVILGFVLFFILEKYLYWRHCHKGEQCEVHTHTVAYLNLLGDGIHNFIDGVVIGTSFYTNIKLGIISTLMIILHEIPQELGDFGILLYGGLSKFRALFYNFLSALTAILGTIVGFFISESVYNIIVYLLPIAAGGFIYIAASDLVPEIQKQKEIKLANLSLFCFIFGVILMYILKMIH